MTSSVSQAEKQIQTLISKCIEAKEFSHSPYSKFRVGAALLTEDDEIITGCNIENASYGLTICAERTAICKAVSEGKNKFKAIAISSDLANRHIVPCGMCRQTLAEFGPHMDIFMTKPDGSYMKLKLEELLPHSFTPEQLDEEKVNSEA